MEGRDARDAPECPPDPGNTHARMYISRVWWPRRKPSTFQTQIRRMRNPIPSQIYAVSHVPSTGPGQSGARVEIPMSPPSLLNSEGIRSAVYLEKGLGSHTLFASGSVTNLK